MPNVPNSINSWIRTHIKKPIKGFDQKCNELGILCSAAEQQEATYQQLHNIVVDMLQRGKDECEIIHVLRHFSAAQQ